MKIVFDYYYHYGLIKLTLLGSCGVLNCSAFSAYLLFRKENNTFCLFKVSSKLHEINKKKFTYFHLNLKNIFLRL